MKKLFMVLFMVVAVSCFAETVYTFKNYQETVAIKVVVHKNGTLEILDSKIAGKYIPYDKDDSGYYFEGDNKGIVYLTRDSRKMVYNDAEKISVVLYLTDSSGRRGFLFCEPCHGTGYCPVCRGTGEYDGSDCMACGGIGKCQNCHGTGEK